MYSRLLMLGPCFGVRWAFNYIARRSTPSSLWCLLVLCFLGLNPTGSYRLHLLPSQMRQQLAKMILSGRAYYTSSIGRLRCSLGIIRALLIKHCLGCLTLSKIILVVMSILDHLGHFLMNEQQPKRIFHCPNCKVRAEHYLE